MNLQTLIRSCLHRDTYKKTTNTDFLFCSGDECKRDLVAGKAFDRILDPMRKQLSDRGYLCTSLALPFSTINGKSSWNCSSSVNRKFAVIEAINLILRSNTVRTEGYVSVLRAIRPKVVIGVQIPPELCEAAKSLHIPVVEVLHGFGYGKIAWTGRTQNQIPSAVISFDDLSTESLHASTNNPLEVFQLDIKENISITKSIFGEQLALPSQSKPQVLFTLQWGYAGDDDSDATDAPVIPNGIIPDSVLEAMSKSKNTIDWHFRFHPKQLSPEYAMTRRELAEILTDHPNAEWKESSRIPLFIVLGSMTHHISMASMAAYEANAFNIPSLFLDYRFLPGYSFGNYQTELRDSGVLTIGELDSDQILDWIQNTNGTTRKKIKSEKNLTFDKVAEILLSK